MMNEKRCHPELVEGQQRRTGVSTAHPEWQKNFAICLPVLGLQIQGRGCPTLPIFKRLAMFSVSLFF